jgi:hypothetical protein
MQYLTLPLHRSDLTLRISEYLLTASGLLQCLLPLRKRISALPIHASDEREMLEAQIDTICLEHHRLLAVVKTLRQERRDLSDTSR